MVKSIDSLGFPMSLSKKGIRFLRDELSYKGFIVADGSDVNRLKDFCSPNNFALEAFKAGCNFFIGIDDVSKSIKEIELSVLNGEIDLQEVNKRCIEILRYKYKTLVNPEKISELSSEMKESYQKSAY